MTARPVYLLGLDLGQASDYSAIVVAEVSRDEPERRYDVHHIERLPLGTRYPAVVAHTKAIVASLRAQDPQPDIWLLLDYTGCGRPVFDLFGDVGAGSMPIPIVITGGDAVTRGDDWSWRVPKRDLAASVQIVLQSGRLRIHAETPLADALTGELVGFRAKTTLSGHQKFEAGEDWRSAAHDDLTLSLAMICWWGETRLLTGRLVWISGDDDGDWD
jgi:hypothetical protein